MNYKNDRHLKALHSFKKPAIYKIEVRGLLDNSWSNRIGGMQIIHDPSKEGEPVTCLIGQLTDQSALSGVLNILFEHHFPIISVSSFDE